MRVQYLAIQSPKSTRYLDNAIQASSSLHVQHQSSKWTSNSESKPSAPAAGPPAATPAATSRPCASLIRMSLSIATCLSRTPPVPPHRKATSSCSSCSAAPGTEGGAALSPGPALPAGDRCTAYTRALATSSRGSSSCESTARSVTSTRSSARPSTRVSRRNASASDGDTAGGACVYL